MGSSLLVSTFDSSFFSSSFFSSSFFSVFWACFPPLMEVSFLGSGLAGGAFLPGAGEGVGLTPIGFLAGAGLFNPWLEIDF
jgi:hypothetical protein